MSRLSNSWQLAKSSWAVLRADKELIVFPIVSGAAALIVFALFALPLWASGYFDRLDDGGNARVTGFVVLFALYVVLYTVINFCNAALVGAALIRLRGGDPTARDGFNIASQHVGAIVGVVLRPHREVELSARLLDVTLQQPASNREYRVPGPAGFQRVTVEARASKHRHDACGYRSLPVQSRNRIGARRRNRTR